MTKEKFIEKWKAWFSYVLREDLALELQADLEKIENELSKDNWIKIESEGDLPTDKNTQYSVSKDKKVFLLASVFYPDSRAHHGIRCREAESYSRTKPRRL